MTKKLWYKKFPKFIFGMGKDSIELWQQSSQIVKTTR